MNARKNSKLANLIIDNIETSVSDFAKQVGLSRMTLINVLVGAHQPTLRTTKKICKYFNVDFRDYLGE